MAGSALLAGLLPEPLDVLRGLALGHVRGQLLAGLPGQRVEVALLRRGDRVAAGHPLARVLLQRRVAAFGPGGAEHLLVVLGRGLARAAVLLGGLAALRAELAVAGLGGVAVGAVGGGRGVAVAHALHGMRA